jgi:two-component system response regulator FixJ
MNKDQTQPLVLVIDDDEGMRDSLSCLLQSVNLNCKLFSSANEFLECGEALPKLGCILLDIRMPGMDGMELLENLQAQGMHLPVIIFTGHGDVPLAVRSMKQGAFDFIQKPFQAEVLLDRVHVAIESVRKLSHENQKQTDLRNTFDILTTRERQVMELVVEGCPSKTIGTRLGISTKTVETHRASIMRKLKVHNIAELVQKRLSLEHES